MTDKEIFEGIDKRIKLDRDDSDSAYFEALILKLEYLTKLVTAGLLACIGDDDDVDRYGYSLEYKLVRADSIGKWADVLDEALNGPAANFFLPASRSIVKELKERVGPEDWRHSAVTALKNGAAEVGADVQLGSRVPLRKFFRISAEIRNRSRGHGAPTTRQKSRACPKLEEALLAVCEKLQLFQHEWAYLHRNVSGKYRVSPLTGKTENFYPLTKANTKQLCDGVYIYLNGPVRVKLVFSDPDLHDISLPNGNHKNNSFEVLSYITNKSEREDGINWSSPIGQLPPSETEGSSELEPFGKRSFANVPPVLDDYVPRPDLVGKVTSELLRPDLHPILSLTGSGGIGKTTITIAALHTIKDRDDMPYEVILWISARDIDLLESGAKPVRPRVVTQEDIASAAVELLGPEEMTHPDFNAIRYFQECLQSGAAGSTLFVLDNFETVHSLPDVFHWLDTHIRPPNKVIITTRIREFRGDFPLEISGMTDEQADVLIDRHSDRLNIRELVSSSYKKRLISESDGHPYVIRIMLGQVAEERRTVSPKRIMADSDHMLRALFERTYNALDQGAKKVFLLLSKWRVFVPEIAIQAVLIRPGNDRFKVNKALDQLHRFSLIERRHAEEEDHMMVGTPLTASSFGRTKLETSTFRISVEDDLKLLMKFGPGRGKNAHQRVLPRIEKLYAHVASQARKESCVFEEYKPVLEFLAESLPSAFIQLSDIVWEINDSVEMKKQSIYYLRRYLEAAAPVERQKRQEVWRKIADRCRVNQDTVGEIHALCEAALLSSSNPDELGSYANHLNGRIKAMKSENIEEARSSEVRNLICKVIEEMECHLESGTLSNHSGLAWLYLNVGNKERARDVVQYGLAQDPGDEYCQGLAQILDM